jgi:pimeloyl-ACP methyl ester carboxylesterase
LRGDLFPVGPSRVSCRTTATCQLTDVTLFYQSAGQGDPLLFIHGLGSSAQDWASQVDCFADQYWVITFDLRGHGQSNKPAGPYSMAQFAADSAALLKQLGAVPAPAI